MPNKMNVKNRAETGAGIREMVPFLSLALVILFFQFVTDGTLLSFRNMKLILNQSFVLMIGTISCSFIVAQGEVDFSMGSMVGITAVCAAWISRGCMFLALPAAMLTGLALGIVNGVLYVKFKIPSFVVTLSMLLVLRGLTVFISGGGSVGVPYGMYAWDNSGLKFGLVILVILAASFAFRYTKAGKWSRAIGSGVTAAYQSGVPVNRMRIWGFGISAMMCGLCGFFNMVRAGSAATNTGNFFETDVLIALVLGGMPLSGGSASKIRCAVIGSLTLAILGNGFACWNINEKLQQGIKGIIFLAAVWLTFDKKNTQLIK